MNEILRTDRASVPGHPAATLSDVEFGRIAAIALTDAGLSIPKSKLALVQSRITKRMRATSSSSYSDYLDLVSHPNSQSERRELISVLTTNVTSFFREKHHFQHFVSTVLPRLKTKLAKGKGPARIWSAGCSTGQEPYSIAIECLRAIPDARSRGLLILASDIDPASLNRASAGRYTKNDIAVVSDADRMAYLQNTPNGVEASPALRQIIRFRELNLHGPWPMRRGFDAIFCRNVLIYFDEDHQRQLWSRFRDALRPGGFLYLGHSERIHPIEGTGFSSAGITIYEKT